MPLLKRRRLVKHIQPQSDLHPINIINKHKLFSGSYYIPKNNDLKPLGEDAHFICDDYQTIGVADGVGGWARKGIDAGDYARELMSNAVFSMEINYEEGDNKVNPMRVLNEAFLDTEAKGSSTACIITLKNLFTYSYLHAANIGDSGFIVIRDDKIVYKSPVQQGGFNCPYQLGTNSPYSPDSAMELVFPVVAGDIVVLGTDGLFDNVFDYEMENVVKLGMMEDPEMSKRPELLAWLLAEYTLKRAEDKSYCSPFEKAAKKAGYQHVGGKYDDITVVVAYVRSADESDPDSDSDPDSIEVLC